MTKKHPSVTVHVMDKRFELSEHGKQLWTREVAAKIRVQVNEQLGGLKPGEALVIDAHSVEVFDYSFANELFGKTLHSLQVEYPERFIIIENLTEYTRENLSKALESLGLAAIERENSKLHLLGKLHPADQDTFKEIASAKKPLSAVELKDKLGINLTAMNERLAKLTSLSLIRRTTGVSESGRKQYLYTAPE